MKYKLRLDLELKSGFRTLYRIERLSDGTLGGYIEKESNLSQEGTSWVYGDAQVFEDAHVCGSAQVFGDAQVYGDAQVSGDARVYGDARVSGKNHILNIIFSAGFSITITPDNIVIGCQLKQRSGWLQVSKEDAVKMGLKEKYYEAYLELLKAGIKLVPDRKDIKE